LPYLRARKVLLRDQELRVVKQLLHDAATAYNGDILLSTDLYRMAVPPGETLLPR
jgi:hypothetical protein